MENRFGLKDLILLLLLVAVIVVLLLGMKQYDRQWNLLRSISDREGEQATQLQDLTRVLNHLAKAGPRTVAAGPQLEPTSRRGEFDPFQRVQDAQKQPGYAQGDALIEGITTIEKITPLVTKDQYGNDVISRVVETLLRRDRQTLAWYPYIAKSLPKISADGLTFTFDMRDDVTFSDGQPLTADDLVFTYKLLMNEQVECPRYRAYFKKVQSATSNGPYEVIFKFKEPFFRSMEIAGTMPILPKHFYSKYTTDQINKIPGLLMGSGAYRMESPTSWTPGTAMQLVRNERYWGPPAPFDKIIYRTFGEDVAKLTAFRNGEIDSPDNLFPEQYETLLKDPAVLAHTHHWEFSTPADAYRYIGWNEKRNGKPTRFADPRVRMAMTLLTDRQRICTALNNNLATEISGPFFGGNPQADPTIEPWPHDPGKAAALLKEAGYSDPDGTGILRDASGKPFEFQIIYPSGNPAYEKMVSFLKDAYAQAGITMDLNPLQWPVFTDKLKNRDFDAITLGWGGGIETDLYQIFSTDQIADGGDNAISYSNPKLDALINQARRTLDTPARMKLWQQCHRILHEDQPYTFLLTRKDLEFLSDRFQNVQRVTLGLNSDLEWFVPLAQQKR